MPQNPRYLFRVTGVLDSTADAGEVRVQLGDPTAEDKGVGASAPVWGVDGFISRPNPPSEDGQSAIALWVYYGQQKYVIGSKDNRFAGAVGTMDPGDRAIVTDADARWFLKRETSALVSYTVNQKTQDSMVLEVNGKDGEIRCFNGIVGFAAVNDGTTKKLLITTGATTILLDEDGVFITGAHFGCNTNGGNFGLLGIIPPIAPAFSVLVGPTGMAGAPSTKFTMAP